MRAQATAQHATAQRCMWEWQRDSARDKCLGTHEHTDSAKSLLLTIHVFEFHRKTVAICDLKFRPSSRRAEDALRRSAVFAFLSLWPVPSFIGHISIMHLQSIYQNFPTNGIINIKMPVLLVQGRCCHEIVRDGIKTKFYQKIGHIPLRKNQKN